MTTTELVVSGVGVVHKRTCTYARGTNWSWAQGRRLQDVRMRANTAGYAVCKLCKPLEGVATRRIGEKAKT